MQTGTRVDVADRRGAIKREHLVRSAAPSALKTDGECHRFLLALELVD